MSIIKTNEFILNDYIIRITTVKNDSYESKNSLIISFSSNVDFSETTITWTLESENITDFKDLLVSLENYDFENYDFIDNQKFSIAFDIDSIKCLIKSHNSDPLEYSISFGFLLLDDDIQNLINIISKTIREGLEI